MTIWEILIGAPMAAIIVFTAIIAVIGFFVLIAGLPFLIVNFYKNKDKISFKEIFIKTYF